MERFALYAGASLALMGAGGAAWHWTPLVGPQAQFERKDNEITDLKTKLKVSLAAVKARDEAIKARDAATAENAATAATEAAQLAAMMKTTCKGAFDAGYASRRCGSGAPPAGVRDLRSIQAEGAFRPSGDVSAEPQGHR